MSVWKWPQVNFKATKWELYEEIITVCVQGRRIFDGSPSHSLVDPLAPKTIHENTDSPGYSTELTLSLPKWLQKLS